jgi:phosphopantetheinyl transferase
MTVKVWSRAELAEGHLTDEERDDLRRLALTGRRADEWIAGRIAIHRVLGAATSVTTCDDGAPDYRPAPGARYQSISLSHDGGWVAVAAAEGSEVAVDLCTIAHAARLGPILARLGVVTNEPCLAWAAIECALKLRRRAIWSLLDGKLAVADGRVSGIGEDVRVDARMTSDYALAWVA